MAKNTDKRFGVLVLPYEKRELSLPKEIMVDYDSGHIFVKNRDGSKIFGTTKDIQLKLDSFISNAQYEIEVTVEGLQSKILKDALSELKSYTDAMVQGLSPKGPARVISLENINIEGIPGPIDDIVIVENDIVLLNGQIDKTQNGKWIVKRGPWERPVDFDEDNDFKNSAFIFINEGTKYGDTGWVLTTDGEIKLGETELDFEIFSRAEEIKAGVGLIKDGNVLALETVTTAGVGTKITYDEYGRVISSETPTSIEEIGITDVAPLSHIGKGNLEHSLATLNSHGFLSSSDYNEFKTNTQSIKDIERDLLVELSGKSQIQLVSDNFIAEVEIDQQFSIVDNLNSTATDSALSANQGRIINKKIDDLFTNKNPNNPVNLNIWTGTLDQYEALINKDPNTIYYIEETRQEMRFLASSGTNPTVVEELLRLIDELKVTKADKNGETFTGNIRIGTESIQANLEINGDIYSRGKLISELFANKIHNHKISEIENLEYFLNLKANSNHSHHLSELNQNSDYQTVNQTQIDRWDNGSEVVLNSIEEHNMSLDSHTDIREDIQSINEKIYNNPVSLNTITEETIIESELTASIPISFKDFNVVKNTIMVFANTTFVSPNRYSIDINNNIVFNVDELPIAIGTTITVIILDPIGLSFGEINIADIEKTQLSPQLKLELENKSDKSHNHIISDVNGLYEHITGTNETISQMLSSLASKIDTVPGMGLSSNDFSDRHLATLNKNTEDLSNINFNIDSKVNGSGNIYTDLNIETLGLDFPVSLEVLCQTLPNNTILSCDSWILNIDERPDLYGYLFIQKSDENRVIITFYKAFDNNKKGFESWSCSFNNLNSVKLSEWELNVTDQLFNVTGFGKNIESVDDSIISADDLKQGVYISSSLRDAPETGKIQYITYHWNENSSIQFAYTLYNTYIRSKENTWNEWCNLTKEQKSETSSLLNGWGFSLLRSDNNISFIKNGSIVSVEAILTPGSTIEDINICAIPFGFVPSKTKDIKVFDYNSNEFAIISLNVDGFLKFKKQSTNPSTDLILNFNYQI